MREILYRGKTKEGKWVYGFYLRATHHYQNPKGIHEDWIVASAVQQGGWVNLARKFAVLPETLGQSTGLPDSHGNKIFEGDKLRFVQPIEGFDSVLDVVWHDTGWCVKEHGFNPEPLLGKYAKDMEIVGNIYDTPELI